MDLAASCIRLRSRSIRQRISMRHVVARLTISLGLSTGIAAAYTAPLSTPSGITIVDVSESGHQIPKFLWRRLGDSEGRPLYTYDADQSGNSSCYDQCAKEFPPFMAPAHAEPLGDWSILVRSDHLRQWCYQGKPLYRYSGKDPGGEPNGATGVGGGVFGTSADPERYDPASKLFSPKAGWRRAAYTPEKSTIMPPNVELEGLAIASGFGFVDAASHRTIYAAPASHRLANEWQPVRASALALPLGDFSVIHKRDGTRQWTYKGEALYTYAGDYAPGEVTGIFAGDKVVQAALAYRNFVPNNVQVRHFSLRGPLMTTTEGQTLYFVARFFALYGGRETRSGYGVSYNDAKSQGTRACQDQCTSTWKPLLAAPNAQASGYWEVISRSDGARQWAFKGSPLYTYVGDSAPGDIKGNNRHVIVYGGSEGQIVYLDAGGNGDTRDPQPLVGKLDMRFAVGGSADGESAPNVADAGVAGQAPGAPASPAKSGRPGPSTASGLMGNGVGAGAGFYWHTVGLFY